ncbi:MAG: Gfo/Idh/MocA family oxidoreductase [Terriglobia bacterium]|jgi:predicted dehydrogenase
MKGITRRDFLKRSQRAALAAGFTPALSVRALKASDTIGVGLMGAGGRGTQLVEWFAARPDVAVISIADPDTSRAESCAARIEKITGRKPAVTQDFRRMLDDRSVDVIINATPDHWHALGTILACQAGKDVYVEKPASHSLWEGRKTVEAARQYGRVVQAGAQNRSAQYCQLAFDYIRSSDFGDVHLIRVQNSKLRDTIGRLPDTAVPPGIDYDMWLGPAPMRPFNMNHFHYNWHWFWVYSGGDIINDGVHQIDLARWMSGETYPKSVSSTGGIFFYNDDQETPDTHIVNWDFDKMTIIFEQSLWSPYMRKVTTEIREGRGLPNWPFTGTRIEIYGTKQFMFLSRHGGGWQVFDAEGKAVKEEHGKFSQSNAAHIANFLDCVRTRTRPRADIEEVHISTAWCQYGNIAYRTGRKLHIDAATEGFVNDPEASSLLKRTYRAPWVVPERV